VPGRRVRRLRADLEQAEVVVVGGVLGAQERRARVLRGDPEAEDVSVEGDAAGGVAHVQDGVVELVDRHRTGSLSLKAQLSVPHPRVGSQYREWVRVWLPRSAAAMTAVAAGLVLWSDRTPGDAVTAAALLILARGLAGRR